MSRLCCCFVIAACAAALISPAGLNGETTYSVPTPAPSIAVFLDFEKQPSHVSIAEMKHEVADIMRDSGLQFDWRLLSAPRGEESFRDLIVLKFKGSCQTEPVLLNELGPVAAAGPLAETKVSDGHILPFTDVLCDEIRRYIAPSMSGTEQRREEMYGRALGRVVAHEMYHIFAGTEHHSKDGIARSFHRRSELVGRAFRFEPRETATLRELKWRSLLAAEGNPPER